MGNERIGAMQVQGPQRRAALERFAEQLSRWRLAMPAVEPLVMDFGLGDFARTGLIEYWIANEIEAGYCGKYLFVFDGQTCPAHCHRHKHETFFVVKGTVRLTVDGRAREMGPGDVLPMPPGQVHSFAGVGNALLLEVSTPCLVDDNQFEDAAVAAWLARAMS